MAAGLQSRPPCAVRSRLSASAVVGLGLLVVFFPGVAGADTISTSTSFDDRFAAVESSDQLPQAQSTRSAVAPKDHAGDAAKIRVPASVPDGRARYRALIEKEAAQAGLPPEVAEAVMAVESGYNPDAIGGVGEIGLMQILPSTAAMLGFRGTLAELAVPETNIRYGVTYLAKAWRLAGGDLCTAAMKYRAGHGENRFSVLSVNYCTAVRSKLAARGFRVTGSVPVATFGEPGRSGGCGRKCLGVPHIGSVNIAALNTRLSALVVQARAGR
ncbi:lytic transglycosylase domain-containing protein [Bradyrhizobium sp. RDT10]